jgi:hypothetical protein
MRTTSTVRPPATKRSACAVASPTIVSVPVAYLGPHAAAYPPGRIHRAVTGRLSCPLGTPLRTVLSSDRTTGLFVPDVNGGRVVAYGKIVAERPLRGAAFVTGIVVLSAATLYQLKHHCEQYYTDAAA